MAEPTLLDDDVIKVTRRRIIVSGQTYDVRDVTTVSIGNPPLPRILLWVTAGLGIVALVFSQASGNLACLGAAVVFLAGAGYLWWRANRTYTLVLGTPQGEKSVLVSRNRQHIDRVAQTIDSLIVERGRMGH